MVWMKNSVNPDQLASDEASWSGSTLFSKEGTEFWKYCVVCSYFVDYAAQGFEQFNSDGDKTRAGISSIPNINYDNNIST